MAVLARIKVCEGVVSESLTTRDVTGLYDASDNTGGFGTPNDSVGDITVASLVITNPGGTEYTFNLLTDTSHTWPSSDLVYFDIMTVSQDSTGALVTGSSGGSKLTEGIYLFDYSLTGPGGTYTQHIEHYVHYASSECVKGMFAELDVADCACDTDALEKALYAYGLHEALRCAIQGAKTERIADIQAAITKICNNTNC